MAFLPFKPGKDFSIFLVCLCIAFLFWLLNAYSKDYTTQVSFPVRYTDIPMEQVLTSEPPAEIQASLTGFGFRLLSYSLFNEHDSISISFNDGRIRKAGESYSSHVNVNIIEQQVRQVVPGDLNLDRVFPDTVRLVVESQIVRDIPVKASLQYELTKQFFLKEPIRVSPESITVKGPQSLLDKADSIATEFLDLGELDKRLVKDVAIVLPTGLSSKQSTVSVEIPVEQYTEGEIELPIQIKSNEETETDLVLIPTRVSVKYLVGLSDFKKIESSMFQFSVDPSQAGEGTRFLMVHPEQLPESVKLLEYSPHKVEYFIRN